MVGGSTATLIGHIAAHVTRVDKDAFEIIVLRGFAESLWDDLARMRRIRVKWGSSAATRGTRSRQGAVERRRRLSGRSVTSFSPSSFRIGLLSD